MSDGGSPRSQSIYEREYLLMQLTIAIPTYNRNAVLLGNLQALMPQLTPECRLLIIDNCSDVPVSDTLQPLLSNFGDAGVKIVRNGVNIGGNANIMRCFELCETELVWVLADDDTPRPGAVEIILRTAAQHPDCLYYNFSSGYYSRDQELATRGLKDFVRRVDSLANVLFISPGVYRAGAMTPYLKVGYTYTYSHATNLVLLLLALGTSGTCFFSKEQIINWNPPLPGQQWAPINLGLGLMTVLELPLDMDVREKLAAKLQASIPHIEHYVVDLLLAARQGDPRSALYLYDQLCSRMLYFNKRPRTRVKIIAYRLALMFPQVGYRAIETYKQIRGGKVSIRKHTLVDRFERM